MRRPKSDREQYQPARRLIIESMFEAPVTGSCSLNINASLTSEQQDTLALDVTDPAHPLIQLLLRNGARLTGAPWFCDAAVFAQAGIPAVAAGPGFIAQAHTNDEWLSVAELEQGVHFYRAFLEALVLNGPGHWGGAAGLERSSVRAMAICACE